MIERLGQVVGLGHDVAGALVVDPLEALVAVHEDDAGGGRGRPRRPAREAQVDGATPARRLARGRRGAVTGPAGPASG